MLCIHLPEGLLRGGARDVDSGGAVWRRNRGLTALFVRSVRLLSDAVG